MFTPKLEPKLLLAEVVKPCTEIFMAQCQLLNLQIVVETKLRDDPCVSIDKIRVQQIIINLVQNSIKYSRHGGTIIV